MSASDPRTQATLTEIEFNEKMEEFARNRDTDPAIARTVFLGATATCHRRWVEKDVWVGKDDPPRGFRRRVLRVQRPPPPSL